MLGIFSHSPTSYNIEGSQTLNVDPHLRQLAGLVIKNYVFPLLTIFTTEVQARVKSDVLQALRDANCDIRNTAAILIGKISESLALSTWSDMLPTLLSLLDTYPPLLSHLTTAANADDGSLLAHLCGLDGAIQAVKRMCEDSPLKLAHDDVIRPLESLVPKLLAIFAPCTSGEPNPNPHPALAELATVKLRALESYNSLLMLLDIGMWETTGNSHHGNFSRSNWSSSSNLHSATNPNPNSPINGNAANSIIFSSSGSNLGRKDRNESFHSYTSLDDNSTHSLTSHNYATNNAFTTNITSNANNNGSCSNTNAQHSTRETKRMAAQMAQSAAVQPLVQHMNSFIQLLANMASDPSPHIRRGVCQAICTIAGVHVCVLEPYFASICVFMLAALADAEESVAIEACDFWMALLTQGQDIQMAMRAYLPELIRNLIRRLYLTSEQMEQERIDEEEESTGEKELSIKPIHHRSGGSARGGGGSQAREESELSSKWTLRKQAALTLDQLCCVVPASEVLPLALPPIQSCLATDNTHSLEATLVKESGMLALGALATGCLQDMIQYLPSLFPFLIQSLQDPLPEMRSISCWVLSRYSELFQQNNGTASPAAASPNQLGLGFYEQTLSALLAVLFDPKPKVQVAACSALCLLIENSFFVSVRDEVSGVEREVNILVPFIHPLLTALHKAFDMYGVKSTLILIDTIGTLADTVREEIARSEYTPLYLPKVMDKFNELDDTDMRLIPVCECLSSVLGVVGLGAQQHIQVIYSRCLRLLSHSLQNGGDENGHYKVDESDGLEKDFAICALDVLSSLCEGLQGLFAELVSQTGTHDILFALMFSAMRDSVSEVRQSAFSLSGELVKHSFAALMTLPRAERLVELILPNLDTDHPLVSNNAAWTLGELAMQTGGAFLEQYIPHLMHALISALQTPDMAEGLKGNIGVTLGRLGLVCPNQLAPFADEFFGDWCR